MDVALTPLCKIAYKYGTDKCPQIKHAYTPFYYKLLNARRNSIKKVLEVGIGHYRNMQNVESFYEPGLKRTYHRGASLYMWRDFFSNSQVFGADRVEEAIFQDDRIKTFLSDERSIDDIKQLVKEIGPDIDLVVDDASHHVDDQIFLAQNLLPLLNPGFIYIIEDVMHSKKLSQALSKYETYVYDPPREWHGGMLFVIKNKT